MQYSGKWAKMVMPPQPKDTSIEENPKIIITDLILVLFSYVSQYTVATSLSIKTKRIENRIM